MRSKLVNFRALCFTFDTLSIWLYNEAYSADKELTAEDLNLGELLITISAGFESPALNIICGG